MTRFRSPLARLAAASFALALLTAACGLKPAALQALNAPGTGGVGNNVAADDGAAPGVNNPNQPGPNPNVPNANNPNQPGPNPNVPGVNNPNQPGSNPNVPGSNPNVPGTNPDLPAGTTIGIRGDTIYIGLHSPITNAAPIPNESFLRGKDLFWKNRTVLGYKVVVDIEDDQYRPSVARQKCEKLAGDHFIVVGGAGTDQIQSCATDKVLRSKRTPYLSAGVTTNGLDKLPDYFAVSTTYADQAKLVVKNAIAERAKSNPDFLPADATWGVVVVNTENFDDAYKAIIRELDANGIKHMDKRVSKDESSSDAQTTATFINTNRFPIVYFLASPSYFVQVLGGLVHFPTFTGVGVSMGINAVANLACQKTANQYRGYFLSPSPGLDLASQNSDFTSRAGTSYDDLMFLLYAISEVLYKMLGQVQGALTREHFIETLEHVSIPGGTFPALRYGPVKPQRPNHFGGTDAWMLRADCSTSPPGGGRQGWYKTFGNAPIKP